MSHYSCQRSHRQRFCFAFSMHSGMRVFATACVSVFKFCVVIVSMTQTIENKIPNVNVVKNYCC